MFKTLEDLVKTIRDRKKSSSEKSYTHKLLNNKKLIIKKVEEELKELKDAINNNNNQVHESADLMYHLLVLLESNDIKIEKVLEELKKRTKQSGLEEKSSRG